MAEIITFQAQGFPFKSQLFNKNVNLKVLTYLEASFRKNLTKEMKVMVKKLFTSIASSAGIKTIFALYGLVCTKLRNLLGVEKFSK